MYFDADGWLTGNGSIKVAENMSELLKKLSTNGE